MPALLRRCQAATGARSSRRKWLPFIAHATYILQNIAGGHITVHCTITAQMMKRAGYLEDFLKFWTPRPEVGKVWFSLFTPQRGDSLVEMLSGTQRQQAVRELLSLRRRYSKLDMPEGMIQELAHPPFSPQGCIFAQTTRTISADLATVVTLCQFGGNPDCSQCGCIASMGLAAVGHYRLGGLIPVGSIFRTSAKIASVIRRSNQTPKATEVAPFHLVH